MARFDEYFLEAVALANATRAGTGLPRYRHMAQPWLLALLLDCERAGMRAWLAEGESVIKCPPPLNVLKDTHAHSC